MAQSTHFISNSAQNCKQIVFWCVIYQQTVLYYSATGNHLHHVTPTTHLTGPHPISLKR